MNKTELVQAIAKDAGITVKQASLALGSALDNIAGAMESGDGVTLPGFGTFSVSKRDARTGRNPRTGEAAVIPARNAPHFKASSKLKEQLN